MDKPIKIIKEFSFTPFQPQRVLITLRTFLTPQYVVMETKAVLLELKTGPIPNRFGIAGSSSRQVTVSPIPSLSREDRQPTRSSRSPETRMNSVCRNNPRNRVHPFWSYRILSLDHFMLLSSERKKRVDRFLRVIINSITDGDRRIVILSLA